MGIIIPFIFSLLIFIILISNIHATLTYLKPTQGIKNIEYHSEGQKLSFQIPLESSDDIETITLNFSEPKKINRENCESTCSIHSNIMNCEIEKSDCELLQNTSFIIRIESIIENSYEFTSYDLLTSEINFETTSIEMTCSNYKLSFFLYSNYLNKHSYENMNFSFPIYYRDKKEEAQCIFPNKGKYIPCVIDATKILFQKDYSIDFDINNPIKLNDDLNITINNFKKYKLEDDCGKDINNNSIFINNLSFLKKIKIFLFIYFLFCFHL